MSLHDANRSANRGECVQICRRSYTVTDNETGNQLEIDNKYIMSPKDLKSVRFIDKMMDAGVRVFKIEGRARGPEYVHTVVSCYKEAIESVLDGTFTEEKKDKWDERLSTVFNRGFWDGYYQGQKMGEWTKEYGNKATEKKVLIGKVMKYFSRLGVAEIAVEANTFARVINCSSQVILLEQCSSMLTRYVTTSNPLKWLNKDGVSLSLYLTRCALTTSCLSWLRVNLRK